jgi:hypothetical protein
MFSDATTPLEVADRLEAYKASLNKAMSIPAPHPMAPGSGATAELRKAVANPELSKSVSPSVLHDLRDSLAKIELAKDLTLAGPGSTGGLVAFDLQAPAQMLAPHQTPLRNRIPRKRGIGTSHRFKSITGFSNSGTGGLPNLWPGITETGTNTVAGQTLRRGPVISYAGNQVSLPYMQFSFSDAVTWEAEFAGVGFEDIRQLSTTSLLYSTMLAEEKMLIGARGTASPYSGALGAPTTPTVTCTAAGAGQTAATGITSKAWVAITATTIWGESALSATGNASFSSGNVVNVSWPQVAGATGYNVYVGSGSSDPTNTGYWYQASTAATTYTVQGAVLTSGTAASTINGNSPSSDTTAYATGYDGVLSWVLGSQSGYVNNVNSTLSSNAGAEIQVVLGSLFNSVKANPDSVICNGYDRAQLSNLLQASSSSAYRIVLNNPDQHGTQIGSLVNGVQNMVTGKMLDLTVNDWWPQGTMAVISWTLPIPDSQVSEVWACYNVQDYMSVAWPSIQFSYDQSTFFQGTLCCFAPAWNGAVTGILQAA